MTHAFRRRFGAAFAFGLAASLPAHAQMTEDAARQAAQEVRVLVTEGTAVIGDLQPAINAGTVASWTFAKGTVITNANAAAATTISAAIRSRRVGGAVDRKMLRSSFACIAHSSRTAGQHIIAGRADLAVAG